MDQVAARHGALRPVVVDDVLYGADRLVAEWVLKRIGEPHGPITEMAALGVWRDRRLIAGVVYEGFNGANCYAAIAAEGPSSRWVSRPVLAHLFGYPFVQLGLSRITCLIRASNRPSQRLCWGLGFTPEFTAARAASDGGDLQGWRMFRADCQWIGSAEDVEEGRAAGGSESV